MGLITEEQKKLLAAEWKDLCTSRQDKLKYGTIIFRLLFTKHPEFIKLFGAFRDLDSLDAIVETSAFKAHAQRFMGAINDIMDSLEDDDCLVELFRRLAESHKIRKVTLDDFYKTIPVTSEALSPYFKTDAARKAFGELFTGSLPILEASYKET